MRHLLLMDFYFNLSHSNDAEKHLLFTINNYIINHLLVVMQKLKRIIYCKVQ
jgi:hypothetical protein